MAPKYMIEIGGTMLVNNLWVDYIRIVGDDWVLLRQGDWEEVYTGDNAVSVINEVKTLMRRALSPPERVDWVRVTKIEN